MIIQSSRFRTAFGSTSKPRQAAIFIFHIPKSRTQHTVQLISWISYRIASIGMAGGFDQRLKNVLADSSRFSTVIQLVPEATLCLIIISFWVGHLGTSATCFLLVFLTFFSVQPAFTCGFTWLGNGYFRISACACGSGSDLHATELIYCRTRAMAGSGSRLMRDFPLRLCDSRSGQSHEKE